MSDVAADGLAVLTDAWGAAQQELFEAVVQPTLYALGGASVLSEAYDATGWFLVGLLQIAVMVVFIAPLQSRWPAQAHPVNEVERAARRLAIRVDVIYTLLHRLGLFRMLLFFAVDPVWDTVFGRLSLWGWQGVHLDQLMAPWVPGWTDTALAGFMLYLVVLDAVNYGVHRAQHHFNWWWALHAVHHSQRHLSMWSDNRNHLLDSLLVDALFVAVARVIGVPPGQFVGLVAVSQLLESLSHADWRASFGRLGARLLVSPQFHRLHHSMGAGHESAGQGSLGGHNFAVLFPVWDVLFGTAHFGAAVLPTGIRDQLPEEGGRDYGQGFWQQQWRGLLRLAGRT